MSNCLYPRAPLSLVLALPSLNHSQLFSLPLLLTLCNLPCCTYGFTAAVSDLSSLFATPFPATTLLYCPFHQLHSREGVPRPTENTVKLLSQPAHFSRLDLHISHLVQTRITSSAHSFKSGGERRERLPSETGSKTRKTHTRPTENKNKTPRVRSVRVQGRGER